MVVGSRAARRGALQRALRSGIRRRADRHEAAARVVVDREPRHHLHRPRACDRLPGVGMPALAALALIAAPLPRLNHAFMKSLLFLRHGRRPAFDRRAQPRPPGRARSIACRGSPGSLSSARSRIAGLPPLNGFVSEWLLLQAFLFAHEVPQPFVNMLLPLGRRARRARRRPRRLRHGQVLWRHLPRPAARGDA